MDRDRAIVTLQSPDDRSDGMEGVWKNSTIAARSSRDWGDYVVESLPFKRMMIIKASMPRSMPDRGLIVARSWPDRGGKRGPIVVVLEGKLKPSHHGIQATSHAYRIAPWTPRNRFHNCANYPRSSDQVSL